MANIKMYDLLKETGIPPKDLIGKLKDLGVDATPASSIDTEDADRLRKYLKTGKITKSRKPKEEAPKPANALNEKKIKEKPVKPVRTEAVKPEEKEAAKPETEPKKTVRKPRVKKAPADAAPEAAAVKPESKPADAEKTVSAPAPAPVPAPVPIPAPAPKAAPPAAVTAEAPAVLTPAVKVQDVLPADSAAVKRDDKPAFQNRSDRPGGNQNRDGRHSGAQNRDNRQGDNRQGDNRQGEMRRTGENRPGGNQNRDRDNKSGDFKRQTGRPGDFARQGDKPGGDRRDNRPQGGFKDNKPGGFQSQRPDQRRGDKPGDSRNKADKPGDLKIRFDKSGDSKLRTDKPPELRPRKKEQEKQREQRSGQETDTKQKKRNIETKLFTTDDSSQTKYKKKKPADLKQRGTAQKTDASKKKQSLEKSKPADKKPKKTRTVKEEIITEDIKTLRIGKSITVSDFAAMLGSSATELVKELFLKKNMMVNMNQSITYEVAAEIAEDRGFLTEESEEIDILEKFFTDAEDEDKEEDMSLRPPVVVVMGHVDHGKTSLLDAIRQSNVTGGEAGGITQHIGAYSAQIDGRAITFLDTPGHEAFTAMRMRGAQVTDIAVLVVAADDGVMPQTVEAINHAKAAGVDIIVAINKIDKPSANPDRVKQELTEYGILVEDWGGDVISVPVSALKREGLDHLLEMILLVSDVKELKANPKKRAKGTVIEAALDKGRGPVATVLVKDGTISVGDPVVAGTAYGKIRAMTDDKGNKVKQAGPSVPVEILGLSEAPQAGDLFFVAKNEKQARQLSESVVAKGRQDMLRETPQKVSLDDLFSQIQLGAVKELNIVIKADVQGSVEAVKTSLEKLSNEEVRIRAIHGGVGAITESDVMLASASNAIIIGFNVRPEPLAKSIAETEKVDLRLYRIIYNAIEDITAAMKGMLDPVFEEKIIGHAQIRQLFKASGVGTIGGCYVTDGKITRNASVRIVRDGKVVHEGTLDALRRFKDDAKEVAAGYECGLTFGKFNDIKEGDIVESFVVEEIPR